jgi:protein-tyrosine kinase
MSRIFKALERAEAEGKRAALPDLQPAGTAESFPEADLPEPRGEYEQLKVALALASNGSDLKSLMFVSTLPGEGVSTVTLGFACAVVDGASQGVLVVDADFARPTLAARLGVAPKAGLAEILAKEVSHADAIQATPVQRLFFLGAGRRPIDLAQARARGGLEELLTGLRATFDYVIVDGGAIQSRSESLLLASLVDAVALVIRAERTGTELARGATRQLRGAGANLLGTILNRRREYLPSFLARRL